MAKNGQYRLNSEGTVRFNRSKRVEKYSPQIYGVTFFTCRTLIMNLYSINISILIMTFNNNVFKVSSHDTENVICLVTVEVLALEQM